MKSILNIIPYFFNISLDCHNVSNAGHSVTINLMLLHNSLTVMALLVSLK